MNGAERGYLRLPVALGALAGGDTAVALAEFDQIAVIADRHHDRDLHALGRLGRGQALIADGAAALGAGMLDEAMLAVTTGETSTIVAGIVYCDVIVACPQVFDLRRAQEWTAELNRWCAGQPDLVPYRGQRLVHRSEIMQLRGAWTEAMDEARKACDHLTDQPGDPALGMALYQQAELLRLRGRYAEAEQGYRRASDSGHPAQPGLALLRLAQGRVDDAAASMRRVITETRAPAARARALAAHVEIALAAGDSDSAGAVTAELATIASDFDSPYLTAVVEHARGCVLLSGGDALAACAALRRSCAAWQQLDAPYEAARTRLRIAQACVEVGDNDTAEMELRAARQDFEKVGAAPALASVREIGRHLTSRGSADLTPREVQVLRLVATGATNKEVAETLVISDKTVARHVANLFTKLGVSSRAGATAQAYQHDLM